MKHSFLSRIYGQSGNTHWPMNEEQQTNLDRLKHAIDTKELHMRRNHCLCNNEDEENDIILFQYDRYNLQIPIVLCKKCGLARTGLVFDDASNIKFYRDYYRSIYVSKQPTEDFFYGEQYNRGKQIQSLLESCNVYTSIHNIAECGCGAGGVLFPFYEDGKACEGYDFDPEYLAYGREKGLNLIAGDFSQAKDKAYDLVIVSHVLEHMLYPLQELEKIISKVKTGGYLVVIVPSILDKYSYTIDPIHYFHIGHPWSFSQKYLSVLFRLLGMKIIYSDEGSVFLVQKINDNIPHLAYIYDNSLSTRYKDILRYLNIKWLRTRMCVVFAHKVIRKLKKIVKKL